MAASHQPNPSANASVSKDEVGWLFVQEYYTILNKEPSRLHLFYTKKSTLVHGNEGESVRPSIGQVEIHRKIVEQKFHDCKVLVSNVDSQSSANGGIAIQVLGEIANDNGPSQKFAQTFFLAEQQPTGYFVLNDIFRYLKEDVEVELEEDPQTNEADDSNVPESNKTDAITSTSFGYGHNGSDNANGRFADANGVSETPEKSESVADIAYQEALANDLQPSTDLLSKGMSRTLPSAIERPAEANNVAQEASVTSAGSPEGVVAAPTTQKPLSWASLASKAGASTPVAQPPAKGLTSGRAPRHSQSNVADVNGSNEATRLLTNAGEKSQFSVFIKHVNPKITQEQLKDVLGGFGKFSNLDINRQKNCAFADFNDQAGFNAAIEANTIAIGNESIIIDERRRGGGRPQDRKTVPVSQPQSNKKQSGGRDLSRDDSTSRGRGRGVARGRGEQQRISRQ